MQGRRNRPSGLSRGGIRPVGVTPAGFFHQHDRNVVFDLVTEPALVANDPLATVVRTYTTLAVGALKDLEQFTVHRHGPIMAADTACVNRPTGRPPAA